MPLNTFQATGAGWVGKNDADYATAHDATAGGSLSTPAVYIGQIFGGVNYGLHRTFLRFNTAAIPAGSRIMSSTLRLYGLSDISVTDFLIRVQKWNTLDGIVDFQAYDEFDGVNYDDGLFNTSAWVLNAYNSINITNFGCINLGGFTNLCVRSGNEVNSIVPTGVEAVEANGTLVWLDIDYISAVLELRGLMTWQ